MEIRHHTLVYNPVGCGSIGLYGVSVFRTAPDLALVVVTEPRSNPGVSVTNAIEQIATKVLKTYLPDMQPDQVLWVERYEASYASTHDCPSCSRETFDLVSLTWDKDSYVSPSWRPIGKDRSQHEFWRLMFQTDTPLTEFPVIWARHPHRV